VLKRKHICGVPKASKRIGSTYPYMHVLSKSKWSLRKPKYLQLIEVKSQNRRILLPKVFQLTKAKTFKNRT
jgi:hypothetical protein